MMLAMLAGANVAKADTVTATVTFDSSVWGTTDKSFNGSATDTWTSSGVTMAITGDDTYNSSISSGYFYVYYPGNLTFTVPTGCTLTGLTITGSGDAVSASTGTMTANATSGGYTWSGSASTLTLTPGTAGRDYYRFESIVVTYEADLDVLATTTSDGAEYRFHRNATPFVDASLHAKTITAGIQEMYFDGFSASTDPMIVESPTGSGTYLHMPAGSRLRLQRSESGSGVYVTRASFTYVSGSPDVSADGGEYDSSTGVWTGRESQVIFLFNEDADIQLVQAEAAAYASVRVSTQGRGQTAVDGTNISLESDPNGNPTGTTTVYVAVGGSLALTMTPDDARHELSTASYTESYWDAEDNYHSDDTDFLAEGKANGSYTMSNIQHDCSVSIVYSWITHLISYHASGNGTINLVATYLDDDGTSTTYDQAEQMYGGEAARDNTDDRKISIGTGGTVNMIMTADTGYKLSSLLVNDVEMVNSENLAKDGSVYTYTINPLTAAQTISATFVNDTPEAYARLTEDVSGNLVLTFYYDTNKGDDDYVVEPFANYGSRGWNERSGSITSVVFDDTFANYSPTSTAYWFYGMTSLTDIQGISNLNTASVTSMSYMFYRCSALTSLDLTGFNTALVTNMSQMFTYCSSLTTIYAGEGWSTAAVQFSANMFTNCTSLVGSKGTTVTNTGADYARIDGGDSAPGYFSDPNAASSFNIKVTVSGNGTVEAGQTTISSNSEGEVTVDRGESLILAITPDAGYAIGSVMVDTLNVTSEVIADSTGVSYYTLARVYDEHAVTVTFVNNTPEAYAVLSENNTVLTFYYDTNKADRSGMDIGPFSSTSTKGWDSSLSSITTVVFDESFANNTTLTSTSHWFAGCSNLSTITGIENLKTDSVTDMMRMFDGCSSFTTLTLSELNTSKVTNMSYMFRDCSNLTNLDLSTFNTENVTDMSEMFKDCTNLTSLNLRGFSTGSGADLSQMFYGCSSLTTLDLSSFNTQGVENMQYMFSNCGSLTNVNLSGLNTTNVRNMQYMFYACSNLESLDLSSFNTANLTDMRIMFSGCTALKTIYAGSGWTTAGLTETGDVFSRCENLVGGMGTTYDIGNTSEEYARIDGGPNSETPGYFTDINAASSFNIKVTVSGNGSVMAGQTTISGGSEGEVTVDRGESLILAITPDTGYAIGSVMVDTLNVTSEVIADSTGVSYYTLAGIYDEHSVTVTFVNDTDEPYAVLAGNTLTFYYDKQKESRGGIDINNSLIDTDSSSPYGTATTASFDTSFANYSPTSTAYWFLKCSSLTAIHGLEYLNTANVTNMDQMFAGCSSLTSLDVSSFDTSKVTDMGGMFNICSSLTSLDMTGFNTQNVTVMTAMFNGCNSLTSLDVSNFKTDNVTDMSWMFSYCSNLTMLDLSNFVTSATSNMAYMFYECINLSTIYGGDGWVWLTISSGDSENMFGGCSSLVGGKGTAYDENYTNYTRAQIDGGTSNPGYFTDKNAATTFDVLVTVVGNGSVSISSATIAGGTAEHITMPAGGTMTLNITPDTGYAFSSLMLDTLDVTSQVAADSTGVLTYTLSRIYDTHTVTVTFAALEPYAVLSENNTVLTFYYDTNKESRGGMDINTRSWDIENGEESPYGGITKAVFDASFADYRPTSTAYWFQGCRNMTTVEGMENLNTSNVTDMWAMFDWCGSLESIDLSYMNTSNAVYLAYMFNGCSSLQSLDVSRFSTDNATDIGAMFRYCSKLTTVDVSHFNTSKVKSFWGLFAECTSLSSLDVSNFDTGSAENMAYMFYNCKQLQSLDVSHFNTQNVTDMGLMFRYCSSLTSLDLSSFNTQNVTNMRWMFSYCSSLTSLDVTGFNTSNVTDMSGLFYYCSSLPSIDVTHFNTTKVTNMENVFGECHVLTNVDVSNFNTENVTNMDFMFGATAISELNLNNFNTDNVTNMRWMFSGYGVTSVLKTVDLSSFNTSKVENMEGMFAYNSQLTTIFVGEGWNTSSVSNSTDMFIECTSLVGGRGTTYDASNIDATYARIDMAPDAPGYFTRTVMMGDANDDGFVTIADAVATVTNILNEATNEYFSQTKADMNSDSEIDIFDVTLIVNAVLAARPAPAYNDGSIAANDVRLEANANSLTMGINGSEEYTAFQFDVTLPEGTTLEGVRLASKATNHQLAYQKVGDNTYRVVGLSMTNQQLSAAGGRLVQMQLSGTADESNVTMSNVLFVGQPATDATAIRNHVADGAADRGAIYDLNGRYVGNDRRQLSKGIYIINHKKVNIK